MKDLSWFSKGRFEWTTENKSLLKITQNGKSWGLSELNRLVTSVSKSVEGNVSAGILTCQLFFRRLASIMRSTWGTLSKWRTFLATSQGNIHLGWFLKLIILLFLLFYKKAFYYLNSVPFFCLPLGFTRALNFVMKPWYCINNSSMLLLVAYCRICVSTSRGETLYYFKLFVHQRLLVHQNSFKQTLNSICQECFVICRSYWLCIKE